MLEIVMASSSEDGNSFIKACRVLVDKYKRNRSYGKAFLQYLVTLKVKPEWKNELKSEFSTTLCEWGKILEYEGRSTELFECYEQALEVFPENELILNNLGAHLCKFQQPVVALNYFKKALEINANYLPAYRNMELTKILLVERWHFRMLNDFVRNESYRAAIIKKVKNCCNTVLDIGTGTGILSVYAKQAGAQKVYSCDYSEVMISIASNVLRDNLLTDSVFLINKLSNEITIPEDISERVSLVVTETFDAALLGEHVLETLIHAWEHLLITKEENSDTHERVIPKGAILYITPIECLKIARKTFIIKSNRIERKNVCSEFNLKHLCICSETDSPYDTENLRAISYSCLSDPVKLFEFNFNDVEELKKYHSGQINKKLEIQITDPGYLDSFAVWFDLILDDEITISSSPVHNSNKCCWEQATFSLEEEQHVDKDSILTVFVSCKRGLLSLEVEKLDDSDRENMIPVPPSIISFLNCESILEAHVSVLEKIRSDFNSQLTVLDASCFPYASALLAERCKCKAYITNQNADMLNASKNLLTNMNVDKQNVVFLQWYDLLQILEDKSMKFNIIFIDILTTSGEINEETIVLIPLLRNLLAVNGLFLPSTLEIHCELVHSDQLMNSSQVNLSNDKLHLARYINEYSVSHMIDFTHKEIEQNVLTDNFIIGHLDMNDLKNEVYLEKEVEISGSGRGNVVLFWFKYRFFNTILFSTRSPDSYINQGAALLEPAVDVVKNDKIIFKLQYNSGIMRFHVTK